MVTWLTRSTPSVPGSAFAAASWPPYGIAVWDLRQLGSDLDSLPPDECARVRQAEERASAAAVGVADVEFLAHPDGLVEAGLALRRDLAAAIRRHRPDVVISINFRESFGGPGFNHADHRNTGLALLDAVRDAANRWLFVGAGGPPWGGVRFAAFGNSPRATYGVDITDTLDRGIASLSEHRAYLEALPPGTAGTDPDPFLRSMAEQVGPRLGARYAVAFEVVPL